MGSSTLPFSLQWLWSKSFTRFLNFILPFFHLTLHLVVLFNWDLPALAWGPLWPANQSPQRLGEAGIWQQSYNGNLSIRMAHWRNKIFAMIISLWWQLVNHRENFRTDLAIQRSSPISMPSQGPTLQFKMHTSKLLQCTIYLCSSTILICAEIRDGSRYQIGWIFGKISNSLRIPPHVRKIILQFFQKTSEESPL